MRNRWGCGETCFSGRLGRVGDGVVVSGREWLFACRMLLQRYTECMFLAPRGKKLQWGLCVERFSSRLENGEEVSLSFVSIEAGRGCRGYFWNSDEFSFRNPFVLFDYYSTCAVLARSMRVG